MSVRSCPTPLMIKMATLFTSSTRPPPHQTSTRAPGLPPAHGRLCPVLPGGHGIHLPLLPITPTPRRSSHLPIAVSVRFSQGMASSVARCWERASTPSFTHLHKKKKGLGESKRTPASEFAYVCTVCQGECPDCFFDCAHRAPLAPCLKITPQSFSLVVDARP